MRLRPAWAAFLASLIAGCATAPAPAPQVIVKREIPACPPVAGARLSTGSDLPAAYQGTLASQKAAVMNPSTSSAQIDKIVGADKIARAAMEPWRTRHPHPTYEQVMTARNAIEALRMALADAAADAARH